MMLVAAQVKVYVVCFENKLLTTSQFQASISVARNLIDGSHTQHMTTVLLNLQSLVKFHVKFHGFSKVDLHPYQSLVTLFIKGRVDDVISLKRALRNMSKSQ